MIELLNRLLTVKSLPPQSGVTRINFNFYLAEKIESIRASMTEAQVEQARFKALEGVRVGKTVMPE